MLFRTQYGPKGHGLSKVYQKARIRETSIEGGIQKEGGVGGGE